MLTTFADFFEKFKTTENAKKIATPNFIVLIDGISQINIELLTINDVHEML